jgi:pyruvate dehydrogenase complex dehydrogenase (E1) component
VLSGLAELGAIKPEVVESAIKEYGLDPELDDPRTR